MPENALTSSPFRRSLLTAFCLLLMATLSFAQRCLLITIKGDTITGTVKFKMMTGSSFAEGKGSNFDHIDLQQGLTLIKKEKSEHFYRPSELQEVFIFPNAADTLHLLSLPKSEIFPAIVRLPAPLLDYDTHALVESSPDKFPLLWCRYYLEINEKTETGYNNTFRHFFEESYTDLLRLDGKWVELPERTKNKKETLSTLLADCPALVKRLSTNKINLNQGLAWVATYYDHCGK